MSISARLPVLTEVDTERIEQLRGEGQFFWLDLTAPSAEDLKALGESFGLHALALEDLTNFGQRPKAEEYGDHIAIVYFGVGSVGDATNQLELVEVHVFVHGGFIVTVHRDPCEHLQRLHDTFDVVQVGSEQLVVYRVLDALTDSFFPLVERIDDEIEQLEYEAVQEPRPEHAVLVMRLKRDLASLRRTVGPQRDVAGSIIARLPEVPGLEEGSRDYFRDVYDHMIRVEHGLEADRVLLSDVLAVHMARTAQRQNDAMERLTVVATIFLPLSFVVGFFGQNFGWMVRAIDTRGDFLVWGVGGLVVSLLLLGPLVWQSVRPPKAPPVRREG